MDKKGFTLVEIIISISLVSIVMVFLFQIITTIKNIYDKQNNRNDTKITVAVITREVERDLSSFGLAEVPTETCDMTNNNIVPSTATKVKCVKLIYNNENVKFNEGYVVYYENNGKYFLGYKRGKDNIIETQTVREIGVAPSDETIDIVNKETSNMKSLKMILPVRDNNDNYDLVINYMSNDGNFADGKHKVSISVENGELKSVSGAGSYKKDETVTINFTFDETLYELVNVSCTNITCDKNQTISFTMPDSDVNIVIELKKKIVLKSFAEDSWETIAANTSSDVYKVGDEKEVEINGVSYTVRIANKSTPSECNDSNFSQTACGFVVEFVDIVETRQMNGSKTNVGGWPAMKLHEYANGDFYNKLPEELRKVIINTIVVSGRGWSNSNSNRTDGNWESQDKIYLLSTTEVWSDSISRDKAYNKTRQLDYYKSKGVTTNNYSDAKKQYDNSNYAWWLRAADSDENYDFFVVYTSGSWRGECGANDNYGFAPAFRISE